MNAILWIHIADGGLALVTGAVAVAGRKGGGMHARVGIGFCVSMLMLGITASMLAPFKAPPDSPIGGIMVCYFVATAWMTGHRRSGTPGRFEKLACATVLLIALAIIGEGVRLALSSTPPSGPPSPGVLLALGGLCLLAGLGDLRFILRGKLSPTQRLSRYLWRMCFAFFIAPRHGVAEGAGAQVLLLEAAEPSRWNLMQRFSADGCQEPTCGGFSVE